MVYKKKLTDTEKRDLKNNIVTDNDYNVTNNNFAQIYNKASDRLIQLIDINPLASKIFLFFIKNMEKNNTLIVSIETIQKVLNRSYRAVMSSLKILKEHNFIVILKFQRNNVYFINPNVSCCTTADHKRKLIKEYNKLSTEKDCVSRQIIDSSYYDRGDKLTYKTKFYKEHNELNPPTTDEIIEYVEQLDQEYAEIEKSDPLSVPDEEFEEYLKENRLFWPTDNV